MSFLTTIIDLILHLDVHLNALLQHYGILAYGFVFCIIFFETAFVITPFLPGDSLLFAAGALTATHGLAPIALLFLLLSLAAILGDTLNYSIGKFFRNKIMENENIRFVNKKHLERTHSFYQKYGNKTIVLARFVPVIRTFAPFIAGVGSMSYWRFALYNIIGGLSWVALFIFGGYYFGNISFVKDHFSTVILAIIVLSIIPAVLEITKHYRNRKQNVPVQH